MLLQSNEEEEDLHPLIAKVREDAIRSQLSDLKSEIREYEALKAGDFELNQLAVRVRSAGDAHQGSDRAWHEPEGPG